ncbi:hypothetical protein TPHA_0L01870 [Tetrapisispora phaffii CBS 4417]|uniref:Uncharacterized protein n=1 Tax=Tetrapisispora phaffii (strain ATCC 24235 / CBS 4417 / NBRC 1672 / NRRL Y-8282 / UCD 70-5) TaxID=1071381 RepID=G8C062_TETPH|nr:hypothetical protein TPHA_0L01870 [Tetrapisispora phaffii CBS 4417]CCE65540.1 hypothetical protein TPHA_0L01870 [Tetrapisispora phaffii CBS 4417]
MKLINLFQHFSLLAFISGIVLGAVLGIDYGHQNLLAMIVSPDAPMEIVLTPESKRKDFSGLAIKQIPNSNNKTKVEYERTYGSAISSLMTRFPQNIAANLKSLLGISSEDKDTIVADYLSMHPGANLTFNDRNSVSFNIDGIEYPVEQLTAMNLRELLNRGNELLLSKTNKTSDVITDIVISVPEYFNQMQRGALLDSALIASSSVESLLLNDGISVAVDFVLKQREFPTDEDIYFIVYDMGNESVQSSLFSVFQSSNSSIPIKVELCGYGYRTDIGGQSFTKELAKILIDKFLLENTKVSRTTLQKNDRAMAKFYQAAEKTKLILSANKDAPVNIESVLPDVNFKTTITRKEFEDATSDLLELISEPIDDMFENMFIESPIALDGIAGLILTGGANRIPTVQKLLYDLVGEEKIMKNVNAEESVVYGVTIRGVKVFGAFQTKPMKIVDKSTSDFSITVENDNEEEEEEEEEEFTIFEKGTQYPIKRSYILETSDEILSNFTMNFYENDIMFRTFDITSSKLKNNFKALECENGYAYNVTFSINKSKIFGIDSCSIICLRNPLQDIESGAILNDDIFMTLSEQINSTNNKVAPLEIYSYGSIIEDFDYKKLTSMIKRLNYLEMEDNNRFKLHALINTFENTVYNARQYLEDITETGSLSQETLNGFNDLISESLEWIDSDIENATEKQINEKLSSLEELMKKLEVFSESSSIVLDKDSFTQLKADGEKLLQDILDVDEDFAMTVEDLEEEYTEFDLDIYDELRKVKPSKYLRKNLKSWDADIEELHALLETVDQLLKKFDSTDRITLFEIKTKLEATIESVTKMLPYYIRKITHQRREIVTNLKTLLTKKNRNLERYGNTTGRIKTTSGERRSIIPDNQNAGITKNVVHDEL